MCDAQGCWGTSFSQWSLRCWNRLGVALGTEKVSIGMSTLSHLSHLAAGLGSCFPFVQRTLVCAFPLNKEFFFIILNCESQCHLRLLYLCLLTSVAPCGYKLASTWTGSSIPATASHPWQAVATSPAACVFSHHDPCMLSCPLAVHWSCLWLVTAGKCWVS